MAQWTIQKLLGWMVEYFTKNNIDSPRLSAELLLSHVLAMQRIELYMHFDREAEKQQLDTLHSLVNRAVRHEPLAYLIGRCEFYSLSLKITPDCLIPRPETELLAERAVDFLRSNHDPTEKHPAVLDLCTGCGCIAVAVAANHPACRIVATDISEKALAVAADNIKAHRLEDKITLLCGNLFDPIISGLDKSRFDLIVSNPPYVSSSRLETLEKNVRDFEPRHALCGGQDGLDFHRQIAASAANFLKPKGRIILEIGYDQGPAVKELFENTKTFTSVRIEKDHSGNDRLMLADTPPAS